jgi:hypothetical protein
VQAEVTPNQTEKRDVDLPRTRNVSILFLQGSFHDTYSICWIVFMLYRNSSARFQSFSPVVLMADFRHLTKMLVNTIPGQRC